jgi:Domain of unknown function (DU1801)
MQSIAETPQAYLDALPPDRQAPVGQLRQVILANLPAGFQEQINYGMLGYVVPHTLYPAGYHCDPKQPLPFLNLASQKNFVALYHMGLYADPGLLDWFVGEWPRHTPAKLDMGKSCLRFKKPDQIPYALLGQLVAKITVLQWIELYEWAFKKQG